MLIIIIQGVEGHFIDEGPLNDAFEFLPFSALH